jgi:hypothetical protein
MMATKKKIAIPKATKCKGWTGEWGDGSVGWNAPQHLHEKGPDRPHPDRLESWPGERFYLCHITVTPILDKRGRPITRFGKTLAKGR